MKKRVVFLFYWFCTSALQGLSQGELISLFPNNSKASQIGIDLEKNIYLLNIQQNLLTKALYQSLYDSLLHTGGQGLRDLGLLAPSKLLLLPSQKIYVLDIGNSGIVILNTDLGLVGRFGVGISNEPSQAELLIQSFAIAPSGEVFLLNALDYRIYKYDPFGTPLLHFGGSDYGAGSLTNPEDISANSQYLMVANPSAQKLSFFDHSGTFQYALQASPSFIWKEVKLLGETIFCFNAHSCYVENLINGTRREFPFQTPDEVLDIAPSIEGIYLLTENAVHLQKFTY